MTLVHAERSAAGAESKRAAGRLRARFGFGPLRGPPLSVSGVVFGLLLVSCATPLSALTKEQRLSTPAGAIKVRSHPEGKPDDASVVAKALEQASTRLAKWGALEQPVDIHLMPSHADLESAVRRYGYDWLRAWAQYDDVLLQAPSTWATNDLDVAELLAHELTHCLMYQRAGTRENWMHKGIPLWFREGMATFTALQGYRWMTLEDLARVYERGAGSDPIADAESMYQSQSAAVYAAAHYAFTFLVDRYGREAVERTLANMSKGDPFDVAFEKGVGLHPDRFSAEFRRYIVWRAFRGTGAPIRSTH
jgi:hypothetical protein